MKVQFVAFHTFTGKALYERGATADLAPELAQSLIAAGAAVAVNADPEIVAEVAPVERPPVFKAPERKKKK